MRCSPRSDGPLSYFLSRRAFNGLIRYNSSGKFNAAYGNQQSGKYKDAWYDRDNLNELAQLLNESSAKIEYQDFSRCSPNTGDLVFCDPPYMPCGDRRIDLLAYSADGFGIEQQMLLLDLAVKWHWQGVFVALCKSRQQILSRRVVARRLCHRRVCVVKVIQQHRETEKNFQRYYPQLFQVDIRKNMA